MPDICRKWERGEEERERAPLRKWLQMPGAAEWIDAPSEEEEEGAMHEKEMYRDRLKSMHQVA